MPVKSFSINLTGFDTRPTENCFFVLIMIIKSVVMDGFKSYGKRTELSGFHKCFNAVTGLNGSGKSNILDAICFALGITTLSKINQDTRLESGFVSQVMRSPSLEELVHKRGSLQMKTASVSITFDNTDEHYKPFGFEHAEEITLCREIKVQGGCRFLINNSKVTRKAYVDLLRSVHLDIENPHFLIMQGDIWKVVSMTPRQLLSMLEATICLEKYNKSRTSALGMLAALEKSLKSVEVSLELDVEPVLKKFHKELEKYEESLKVKEELHQMEKLCIAYRFKETEDTLQNYSEELDRQNNLISRKQDVINDARNQQNSLSKVLNGAVSEECRRVIKRMEEELLSYESEKATLSAKLRSHVASLDSEKNLLNLAEKDLKEEDAALSQKESEMAEMHADVSPLLEARAAQAEEYATVQNNLVCASAGLLPTEDGGVASLPQQLSDAQALLTELVTSQKKTEMEIIFLHQDLVSKEAVLSSHEDKTHDDLNAKLEVLLKEVADINCQLRKCNYKEGTLEKLKRDAASIQEHIKSSRDNLNSLRIRYPALMFEYDDPEPDFDRSNKVFGLVCSLFKPTKDTYSCALETAAGSRLNNVIVDTEETAKSLLMRGNLQRRWTLIPLNRIVVPKSDNVISIAKSLVGKGKVATALNLIEFNPQLRPAMEWVFGDVLVCVDSNAAQTCAFDARVSKRCVTLDGNTYEPAGIMSGGATPENSANTWTALKEIKEAEEMLIQNEQNLRTVEEQIRETSDKAKSYFQIYQHLNLKSREAELLQSRLDGTERKVIEKDISRIKDKTQSLNDRMKMLNDEIKEQRTKVVSLETMVTSSKNIYQHELHTAEKTMKMLNMRSQQKSQSDEERLEAYSLLKIETEGIKESIKSSQEQLSKHKDSIEVLTTECLQLQDDIKEVEEKIVKCSSLISAEKGKVFKGSKDLQNAEERIAKISKAVTEWELELKKFLYKQGSISKEIKKLEKEKCNLLKNNNWIAENRHMFGVADGDFNFKDFKLPDAVEKITNLKDKLRANAAISFTGPFRVAIQRTFKKKKGELKKQTEQIRLLIKDLDDLQEKQITKTCEKVNVLLGSIFSLFIHDMKVKLEALSDTSIMEGLKVKVAFGDVWKEDLSELSLGQKSLVGLSLLLATLSIRPAPVYILDEIDSALDENHTKQLGYIFKNFFPQSQFIIVSLKEGLFKCADCIFHTNFSDGVSSVQRIS